MDLSEPRAFALFLDLYGRLPRAAPGSDAATRKALAMVPVGPRRTVLDLGCGPGAQTLSLAAALPGSTLVALDILPSMVEEARRRCGEAGVGGRVIAAIGDMSSPPVPPCSQDLIWCEGAIYSLGVADALQRWKPLLTGRGCIGFTEAIWLQPDPPEEVRLWWSEEYPALTDSAGVCDAIRENGFRLLSTFVLPAEAWWDDYYRPLEDRLPLFLESHPDDAGAQEVAAAARREISMYRTYGESYGYGFFVVRPAEGR